MDFKLWLESSFGTLYQSAVDAFPQTTRRQHATDTVQISDLNWVPYIGVRTLYLRATADNTADQGGIYRPIIMFRNVEFHDQGGPGLVEITAGDNGQQYHVAPLDRNNTDILCRCSCNDFYWRFNYYDHIDHSLYGRVRAPYVAITNRGPVNPTESPGLCKHLMKLFYAVEDAGMIS